MSNTSCSTTWWFPFFKVSWVAFASIDLVLIFVGLFSMTGFCDFSISMPGPEIRKVKMSPGSRLLPIVCRNTSEPNSIQVTYRHPTHPTQDHDSEFVTESRHDYMSLVPTLSVWIVWILSHLAFQKNLNRLEMKTIDFVGLTLSAFHNSHRRVSGYIWIS